MLMPFRVVITNCVNTNFKQKKTEFGKFSVTMKTYIK